MWPASFFLLNDSLGTISTGNIEVNSDNVTYKWYALAYKNACTKIVSLHFGIRLSAFAESVSNSYLLGTLPEGFRPICNVEHACFTNAGSRILLQILIDGNIQIVPRTAVTENDVFVYHDTYLIP